MSAGLSVVWMKRPATNWLSGAIITGHNRKLATLDKPVSFSRSAIALAFRARVSCYAFLPAKPPVVQANLELADQTYHGAYYFFHGSFCFVFLFTRR